MRTRASIRAAIRTWVLLLALPLLAGCGDLGALFQSPTSTPTPPAVAQATLALPATPVPTRGPAPPPTAAPTPVPSSLLQTVKQREKLICGVNADLPGFGFYDAVRRTWSGFDIDFCRVVAAAVLGDANAVEFRALSSEERWNAIRSGEVDVIFRNSTWIAERDASGGEGVDFGPTTFHDGQGIMVRKTSNITTLADLAGKTVCVEEATTSEANLRDEFAARSIAITPLVSPNLQANYTAYDESRCDAVTSDRSQLISARQTLQTPSDHVVLGELFSREPLGPAFIQDDSQWRDVVSWAVFATIYAEELRVNQQNVESLAATTTDPRIRRLLGLEGTVGEHLGLSKDFGRVIISQVGSYADIYDRNLGPNTPFDLDRGPNKAWNLGQGGVLASPPFR